MNAPRVVHVELITTAVVTERSGSIHASSPVSALIFTTAAIVGHIPLSKNSKALVAFANPPLSRALFAKLQPVRPIAWPSVFFLYILLNSHKPSRSLTSSSVSGSCCWGVGPALDVVGSTAVRTHTHVTVAVLWGASAVIAARQACAAACVIGSVCLGESWQFETGAVEFVGQALAARRESEWPLMSTPRRRNAVGPCRR